MRFFTRFGRLSAGFLFALAMITFTLKASDVKLNNNSNDLKITENTGLGFTVSYSFSEFKTP